ncbi:MAG: threonine synthase [Anaerolineae bacterium]|nr:threonine synthase [Anaerolineae bacterium]
MHTYLSHLECPVCGALYDPAEVTYTCPVCGPVGTLDMVYDLVRIDADFSPLSIAAQSGPLNATMWRYRPLLPVVDEAFIPPLPVGMTPLIPAPRLAQALGLRALWLKDDSRNPTASLKDRASAMVTARAAELGAPVVTTASSGNAGAALAGLCASAGIRAVIFVPASAPQAKITQLIVYGATLFLVQGSYDDAFDLSVIAAERYGWYCRNTGMNPYTTEGKKTAALETAEQLGWRAPDAFVVSVGDGNILAGQYKGFADLQGLGWIDRMPRFIGVQAEGSSSLVRAWREGIAPQDMQQGPAETVADSISVGLPRDRAKAMRAVLNTGGAFVSVPDTAILAAIPELARATGVFAEPAAATGLAGIRQALADGHLTPDDEVVLLITGNGLKDVRGAMRSLELVGGAAHPVEPSADALDAMVRRLGLV